MTEVAEALRAETRRVATEVKATSGVKGVIIKARVIEGFAALRSDDPVRMHAALRDLRGTE